MKKKLLEDVTVNPSRYYRIPGDVLRDRRFSDGERAEILRSWRNAGEGRGPEIDAALNELESRIHHPAH